jgi:hypothetical protein
MLKIDKIDTSKHAIKNRKLMELGVIPHHPSITIFSGSQGGGKSTLVANLMKKEHMYGLSYEGMEDELKRKKGKKLPPKQGFFDAVFCFLGSDDDMYDHLIDSGVIKQNHVCHMPKPMDIQKVIDGQKQAIAKVDGDMTKVPKILCIFDDVVNDSKLMRSTPFLELFVKGRHINSSTFFLSQYLNLVPKPCRLQANWLFVFKSNRAELQVLCDQFCPPNATKKEFAAMVHEATRDDEQNKNNVFVIVKRAPEDQRFRKNLDKFIHLKRMRYTPKIKNVKPSRKEVEDRDFDIENTIKTLKSESHPHRRPEPPTCANSLPLTPTCANSLPLSKMVDEVSFDSGGKAVEPKKKLRIKKPPTRY